MDYISDPLDFDRDRINHTIILVKKIEEEIVVTATRTPKLYAETPVKTEVITATDIQQRVAVNLAEALTQTTGVRVENNCQNCNFTQVRINGMEGKYTQILIDSSPVVSAMTGVYGLEQIPAEMLERIEIVKGGGSVSLVDAKRNTYYGSHQDPNAYGTTKNPLLFGNAQLNWQAGGHVFSFGFQYKRDKIEDIATGYDRIIKETYEETGIFVQDDFKISKTFTLLTGLRINKHTALDQGSTAFPLSLA